MESVFSLDQTPSALERSISAGSKLRAELPTNLQMESIHLKELLSLTEEIHIKTQEASQQSSFNMRGSLGYQ